jgi:nitrous oxide reductase
MHVTIDITAAGTAENATPANFAVRSGGTVTLTFRNHTNLFHTFTVRALGISVLLRPMRATSVTFVAPYGVYVWRCVICSTAAHPRAHAMRGNMYAIVDV